ncbi:hypothetical protein M3Y94_00483400 [Aphelenchoides besseyi]|nr:hypothetical protein M3Y94_00483400 [Aphelenchoides besseyi]
MDSTQPKKPQTQKSTSKVAAPSCLLKFRRVDQSFLNLKLLTDCQILMPKTILGRMTFKSSYPTIRTIAKSFTLRFRQRSKTHDSQSQPEKNENLPVLRQLINHQLSELAR